MGVLPDSELRVVAQLARERIARADRSSSIQNLKVFSEHEVGVTFGREIAGAAGYLVVERVGDHWRITTFQPPNET
jgi:hypothetical protein